MTLRALKLRRRAERFDVDAETGRFRSLMAKNGIAPTVSGDSMNEMETIALLETIIGTGDRLLRLIACGTIPEGRSGPLLEALSACFEDPIRHRTRVPRIAKELRAFEI